MRGETGGTVLKRAAYQGQSPSLGWVPSVIKSRAAPLGLEHAFPQYYHHLPFLCSSLFIRPTLSLSCFERTCELWLYVCDGRHHIFRQLVDRLTVSNRDGLNLTARALVEAIQRVYHFKKPLAYLLVLAGVFLCGDGQTINLDCLAIHNVIEHNASLSR